MNGIAVVFVAFVVFIPAKEEVLDMAYGAGIDGDGDGEGRVEY